MFKIKVSHLEWGHRLWSRMERNGLCHGTLPKTRYMKMTSTTQCIPARSSPGTKSTPSVAGHQDGGEKYGTDGPKSLYSRNNITIVTWSMRSLTSSRKSWRTNTRNEEIPIEHPWSLWGMLEKLRRNIYPGTPQTLFQWQCRQTWAWSWIAHSQRHCECHHGMSTSLADT